ncbi:ATP-binding cassette domain-containing protein [Streptomyces sp. NPDC048409]|uniref:ABC transporter ATP-binding protein n=1 Tax=Streptomyces sp. NPDC048409 TaxID=3154723 RepID=UPI00341BDFAD
MIEAFGLTSNPRKAHPPAVDDVTFEARAGRVTALLGEAGAGKTTALRLMLELQQGRGLTYFKGRPLHRIAHPSREVGVLLGDVPGHPARSVRGHLRMLCAATGVPARRADEVLEAVGLVSLREERLGTLSRGVDRRLGLACALLPDPHTLVLDEPAQGLSSREGQWLHRMLRAHAAQGGTVLFATSDTKEAARAADRVVTLKAGRLVADQEATDFARTRLRPRVVVRSPHAARLAALLTKEARTAHRSVEVVSEGGNRLSVYGSTTAEIGEAAFRHGILVHQLADEVGDMGAGAGAEPPSDAVPEAARRQPAADEQVAMGECRAADERAAADPRDTTGADRRQDTGGSPVTPQPRTSNGPRPVSPSCATEQEPGTEPASHPAQDSAAAERQSHGPTVVRADDTAAAAGSSRAERPDAADGIEAPAFTVAARTHGTSTAAGPATSAQSSPAGPATAPEPQAAAPDLISATVPAQPPSAADAARTAAVSASHPAAVTGAARPQGSTVSPRSSFRPLQDGSSARSASPQSSTPAETSEAGPAQPPVEQPRGREALIAKVFLRKPRQTASTGEGVTTSTAAGAGWRSPAVAPGDSSQLPPAIAVRSATGPLRPLRYELRRAAGIGAGFVTCGAVLMVSALIAVLLARLGHTPQARLFAAWPRELPLPPAALGAGLLGALAFGDEFRHPALAADRGTVPRRLGLLTAKLTVSGATAVLLSFLTLGCDAEMLYLVYGRELAKVPADWLPMTASWFGLIVGCAWAGVLAAGIFRSTTAGLAAVLAVPVLVVPVVHKALQGSGVRMAAGLPVRMREMLLLQWPFGGERYLVAAVRVVAQPVGGAMALSLATLLCAYLCTTLRTRLR